MFKIMIVEDDRKITRMLQEHLEKYGFSVIAVEDFDEVTGVFSSEQPALVLLDVNLPKFDGFYWCRQIRLISACPILFISARDSKMDQVMALEYGADDYITKPFHYEVVVAKIRSHLRRAYGEYAPKGEERTVTAGKLILYPERFELTYGEETVELTQKESKLVEMLMSKAGRVVNRNKLLEMLWEDKHFVDDNTLNVYVTRIRRKFKELGLEEAVETIRGAGYLLKLDGGSAS
ncbi:DNA-binding response regulator [Paenibacillus sp. CAA11]|uniref:response regulator transcription factor n=1 Tax=Paenibacillus sp. CAA11 TaxID=1532905 RepID=UPI000D3C655E|nr:response regulator transcription factor [Paenibacillus sp. CAA11]AWB44082.1 DNA-binding response regulator [Paenibacillus sp. CAA11]